MERQPEMPKTWVVADQAIHDPNYGRLVAIKLDNMTLAAINTLYRLQIILNRTDRSEADRLEGIASTVRRAIDSIEGGNRS